MSRKHKRQKQRNFFPWVLAAFGVALIVIAIAFFVNQSGSGTNISGGIPKLAVDPQKIDYGYVKFGNDKTFTINVTNIGTGILRFAENPYVEVLEGC